MKEQKIIYLNFYKILSFALVVALFSVSLYDSVKIPMLETENLQLKDFKADVFCKSQSYVKVIEPAKILETSIETRIDATILSGNDKEGIFGRIQTPKSLENLLKLLNKTGAFISCDFENPICTIRVPAKTETRNFETGYYNQTDNSYYCQAEKVANIICEPNCVPPQKVSGCKIVCIQEKNSYYQKTEKFLYQ